MPIKTELTGEQARDTVNKVGISRMGYDGLSCYLFLEDSRVIEIRSEAGIIDNDYGGKLFFTEIIHLPGDILPA